MKKLKFFTKAFNITVDVFVKASKVNITEEKLRYDKKNFLSKIFWH
jgi:hypothetical protein